MSYATQKGCNLSRAKVLYFKHNDMADLERVLRGVLADDQKHRYEGCGCRNDTRAVVGISCIKHVLQHAGSWALEEYLDAILHMHMLPRSGICLPTYPSIIAPIQTVNCNIKHLHMLLHAAATHPGIDHSTAVFWWWRAST